MATDPVHERLLEIVKSLPGAYEDRPWGSLHCKVAGKIFVGWGRHDDGAMSVGLKTDKQLQAMLVASDPRFTIAAYVGKHGWVDMKLDPKPDWTEIEQLIVDSYRMIAPKKLVNELAAKRGSAAPPLAAAKQAAPKKAAPKKAAPKKTAKPKRGAPSKRARAAGSG
jgi:predicted DNA-binding protein (MmcQ/YjbR family)